MDNKLLLTVAATGETLSCSRAQAYALVKAGVIPSVKVGSRLRVPTRALEAWIDAQLAVTTGEPD